MRHGLDLDADLRSDVAPLNGLVCAALHAARGAVTAMKDPTRGGAASALHEMAAKSGVGIVLDEAALPVRACVRGVAELVGIDPLLVANEGKALIGVRAGRRRPWSWRRCARTRSAATPRSSAPARTTIRAW